MAKQEHRITSKYAHGITFTDDNGRTFTYVFTETTGIHRSMWPDIYTKGTGLHGVSSMGVSTEKTVVQIRMCVFD